MSPVSLCVVDGAQCSHAVAVHLDNVANLGDVDKLVDQALTVHLGENAALVIVSATNKKSVAFIGENLNNCMPCTTVIKGLNSHNFGFKMCALNVCVFGSQIA